MALSRSHPRAGTGPRTLESMCWAHKPTSKGHRQCRNSFHAGLQPLSGSPLLDPQHGRETAAAFPASLGHGLCL